MSAVESLVALYWGPARRMRGSTSVRDTPRELGLFGPNEVAEKKATLNAAREMWKKKSMQSYSFELEYVWYAPEYLLGPFHVEVRNGVVVKVTNAKSGEAVNELDANVSSIDGLLNLVDESLDAANHVYVDYNSQAGAPDFVYLDRPAEDGYEESSEIRAYVRNIVPL